MFTSQIYRRKLNSAETRYRVIDRDIQEKIHRVPNTDPNHARIGEKYNRSTYDILINYWLSLYTFVGSFHTHTETPAISGHQNDTKCENSIAENIFGKQPDVILRPSIKSVTQNRMHTGQSPQRVIDASQFFRDYSSLEQKRMTKSGSTKDNYGESEVSKVCGINNDNSHNGWFDYVIEVCNKIVETDVFRIIMYFTRNAFLGSSETSSANSFIMGQEVVKQFMHFPNESSFAVDNAESNGQQENREADNKADYGLKEPHEEIDGCEKCADIEDEFQNLLLRTDLAKEITHISYSATSRTFHVGMTNDTAIEKAKADFSQFQQIPVEYFIDGPDNDQYCCDTITKRGTKLSQSLVPPDPYYEKYVTLGFIGEDVITGQLYILTCMHGFLSNLDPSDIRSNLFKPHITDKHFCVHTPTGPVQVGSELMGVLGAFEYSLDLGTSTSEKSVMVDIAAIPLLQMFSKDDIKRMLSEEYGGQMNQVELEPPSSAKKYKNHPVQVHGASSGSLRSGLIDSVNAVDSFHLQLLHPSLTEMIPYQSALLVVSDPKTLEFARKGDSGAMVFAREQRPDTNTQQVTGEAATSIRPSVSRASFGLFYKTKTFGDEKMKITKYFVMKWEHGLQALKKEHKLDIKLLTTFNKT